MEHHDQKYIDALINNNTVVLKELYEKFSGKIKQMVLKNNGTETEAGDIFQEALLSIYNKAKTGNFVLTCPFDAFLYLICKKKWLSHLTKVKTSKVTFIDSAGYNNLGEETFKVAEDFLLQDERRNLLNEKFEELGDGCKELLQLSWSGKTMEEVAEILKVTYGYARKKKSECIGKLTMLVKASSKFNYLKW
ncbi:RNA polymerase sigma factor [Segetibacter koreensis]|uniref:RNA polymerase sigma factor n=1 Tax=Segetibacter koreensis TaxID=398037 RepID=UPI00035E47B5|nr:sigma-70 family RNA polymerase sigma factor [Segetibacter koreensis]